MRLPCFAGDRSNGQDIVNNILNASLLEDEFVDIFGRPETIPDNPNLGRLTSPCHAMDRLLRGQPVGFQSLNKILVATERVDCHFGLSSYHIHT